MRCEDVTTRLDAYAAGEIPPALAAKLAAHLESCESCRQSLGRLKRLAAVLGQASAPPVPVGFAYRVMAKARGRRAVAASAGFRSRRCRMASPRGLWQRRETDVRRSPRLGGTRCDGGGWCPRQCTPPPRPC